MKADDQKTTEETPAAVSDVAAQRASPRSPRPRRIGEGAPQPPEMSRERRPSSSRSSSRRLSASRSGTSSQPQPLIVQGEADATRIDIAARVDGRVGQRPVSRGDNVAAGQLLFEIDNPELVTKLKEAEAALAVAVAQLANIEAGTRAEVIAQRKAAVESASANLTLAQQTYDRIKELAGPGYAPIQRLDEATNSLRVAERSSGSGKARLSGSRRRPHRGGARHRARQRGPGASIDRHDQGAGRRARP